MFKIEYTKSCQGEDIVNLELKQGDTGLLRVNPKQKSTGEAIDFSLLSKIVFKFSSDDYKEIYSKELEAREDYFLLRVESAESVDFVPDGYRYEFECTFVDGTIDTPVEGKIKITEEIKR